MSGRERDRALEVARRDLVEAQHALLQPTDEGLATAILHASLALLYLARADEGLRSLGLLVPALREAQRRGRGRADSGQRTAPETETEE